MVLFKYMLRAENCSTAIKIRLIKVQVANYGGEGDSALPEKDLKGLV